MSKFKVINIYNNNGSTLYEIISKFSSFFLEDELIFLEVNDSIKSNIILNNRSEY